MSSLVATLISIGTGVLLLLGLCAAGFAFLGKAREPASWPFALAIGAALFTSVFYIMRYLLDVPFLYTVAVDAALVLALSVFGVLRMRWAAPRIPRDFILSFAITAAVLIVYPIIARDPEHHVPAVLDLVRGLHPSEIALSVRPFVVGGFYPYGSEALVASVWMGQGNVNLLFRLMVTIFSLASFWLYWRLLRDFFSEKVAFIAVLIFFWAGNLVPLVNF